MKNEHHQHIKDFLDDDSFVHWVLGNHDDRRWRQFPHRHPEAAREFERARRLVRDLHQAEQADSPILDRRQVWNRISANINPDGGLSRNFFNAYPPWQWAVGLALSLGVAWLTWQLQPAGPTTYRGLVAEVVGGEVLIEKTNSEEQPLVFTLEDNSTVTLEKNSRLSYTAHFGPKQRAVILAGEAAFEVKSAPGRPFHVYTNEVVATAYDETFSVRSYASERDVSVKVRQGRVSVLRLNNFKLRAEADKGLLVLPNQRAVFERNSQTVRRRLIDNPLPLDEAADQPEVRFTDTAASTILRRLEAQYGVTILFNDGVLDLCPLTVTLGNEPLRDKLATVCRKVGASFREVDGQFVVESVGCL